MNNTEKKHSIQGFVNVFSYTLVQNFKNSKIKIFTIILVAAAIASMPLLHFFSKGEEDLKFPAETVYVLDETGLGVSDFSSLSKLVEKYSDTVFKEVSEKKELSSNELQIVIANQDGATVLHFIAAADGGISEEQINSATPDFSNFYYEKRVEKMGITNEQKEIIQAAVETKVSFLNSEGAIAVDAEDKGISQEQYSIFISVILVITILIAFNAEAVSSSIAMEKSSKLVETLMLCVKPFVLILGKVAAALCTAIIQVGVVAIAFVASAYLAKEIYGLQSLVLPSQINDLLSQMEGISAAKIILAGVIVFGGVLFYALIAGLLGATVSRMEELGEGMKVHNVLMVLSAYSGIGLSMAKLSGGNYDLLERVLSFLPITAPFIVPMELLMGGVGIPFAILVCVVQVGFLVLFALFVSRVYRTILLYKGERIKIKNIIQLGRGGEA